MLCPAICAEIAAFMYVGLLVAPLILSLPLTGSNRAKQDIQHPNAHQDLVMADILLSFVLLQSVYWPPNSHQYRYPGATGSSATVKEQQNMQRPNPLPGPKNKHLKQAPVFCLLGFTRGRTSSAPILNNASPGASHCQRKDALLGCDVQVQRQEQRQRDEGADVLPKPANSIHSSTL